MCGLTFNYKLPGQNFSPLICHYVTCMLTLIENWGGGGDIWTLLFNLILFIRMELTVIKTKVKKCFMRLTVIMVFMSINYRFSLGGLYVKSIQCIHYKYRSVRYRTNYLLIGH